MLVVFLRVYIKCLPALRTGFRGNITKPCLNLAKNRYDSKPCQPTNGCAKHIDEQVAETELILEQEITTEVAKNNADDKVSALQTVTHAKTELQVCRGRFIQ